MENTNETQKMENKLQREMLDMNKQTIIHLEKDVEKWFKSWWMLSIVYPLITLVGGTLVITAIQRSHAKTAVTDKTTTAARHPIIRDIINARTQK